MGGGGCSYYKKRVKERRGDNATRPRAPLNRLEGKAQERYTHKKKGRTKETRAVKKNKKGKEERERGESETKARKSSCSHRG